MSVRVISFDLQQKAITELNENPKKINEDIENLRCWLKHQRHLKFKDENQFLLGVLRRCKFSIEKAKKNLETYYTMKTHSPEIYLNRDPFKSGIQSMLTTKTIFINTSSSTLIGCVFWRHVENMGVSLIDAVQLASMFLDILINECDAFIINKSILIVDFKDVPLKACLKWDINLLKKMLLCLQVYRIRILHIILINVSPVLERIYNILYSILSKKMQSTILIYDEQKSYKLYETVSRDLLPEEFSGTAQNTENWKQKIENYKNWFKDDEKYTCNEKLRVGPSLTHSEIFGTEGSFRKLDVD
ncbi:hypothetical protein FQR65_LT06011 [Abscondita terminalis]|nr:hypothetical protein FQR65_LT06011 [Abscondita terminalis]